MRKIYFILIIALFLSTFSKSIFASPLSFVCNFEEAHSNGAVNQGLVLFKNNNLRYEYFNDDLFIIFINDDGTFIFDKKKQKTNKITRNIELINSLIEIAAEYPNIPKKIIKKGISINIVLNTDKNFIKRISVDSKNTKMSLYLNQCEINTPINNLFFKASPVFEYN